MADEEAKPECFVIMPVSDVAPYEAGHFDRVFKNLIEPACGLAGFKAVLASQVQQTNVIVLDILKKLLKAEMAVCDLSARNPNVFFELGLRQAFDLPVTLIKDERTNRPFDTQALRDVEYSSTLRIDLVTKSVADLGVTIKNTYDAHIAKSDDVNSLIKLLGITAAATPQETPVSLDTSLILASLQDIGERMRSLEEYRSPATPFFQTNKLGNIIWTTDMGLPTPKSLLFTLPLNRAAEDAEVEGAPAQPKLPGPMPGNPKGSVRRVRDAPAEPKKPGK